MIELTDFSLSTEIGFYLDASTAKNLGFGTIFGNRWIQGTWTPGFIDKYKPSIKYLELFALTVGFLLGKVKAN